MKVWLSPVTFASYKGRKPRAREVAVALRIVAQHRGACLEAWNTVYE
jgi:hypothetical protein